MKLRIHFIFLAFAFALSFFAAGVSAQTTVTGITSGGGTVYAIIGNIGTAHSLFVKSDGSLWGMGDDFYGELGGIGGSIPEELMASNVKAVATGFAHTLILKSDGSLWAVGDNSYGQLGDGTTNSIDTPEVIVSTNVTAIAAGSFHSLFLKSDGSLWAMGYNGDGSLGDGTFVNSDQPVEIEANSVTTIAAGDSTSMFIKGDGSLWDMGDNADGQLGTNAYIYGGIDVPQMIESSNVVAIAAGAYHNMFIMSGGSLWVMGDNSYGELGDGTTDNGRFETNEPEEIISSGVAAIAAGYGNYADGFARNEYSLFMKSDGSLWDMGDNAFGELGDGTFNGTNAPEEIVDSGVVNVFAGANNSFFIKNDGSLWGMGYNADSALGDGTDDTTNRPELLIPNLVYAANPDSGLVPLTVEFSAPGMDSDGNPISRWTWNFGDGSISTNQNPSHIYVNAGTFYPGVVAVNSLGNVIRGIVPSIITSLPTIQFTANVDSGTVPLTVQFSAPSVDSGGNAITQWNWNFGDGWTSTQQNPSHTYTITGNFSPSLVATNDDDVAVQGTGPTVIVEPNSGLVENGAFETGDFTGWTLSGDTSYTFVDDGSISGIAPFSGNYLAALGTSTALGYLSQNLLTVPGRKYLLSLWMDSPDGETPNEFIVDWSGMTLFDQANMLALGWTNLQFDVLATSPITPLMIGFSDISSYLGLDDVSVVPITVPVITNISLSGTNLTINGTCGTANATYYVLMSTNIGAPFSEWTRVFTDTLSASGNFTINVPGDAAFNVGQRFFVLQMK